MNSELTATYVNFNVLAGFEPPWSDAVIQVVSYPLQQVGQLTALSVFKHLIHEVSKGRQIQVKTACITYSEEFTPGHANQAIYRLNRIRVSTRILQDSMLQVLAVGSTTAAEAD